MSSACAWLTVSLFAALAPMPVFAQINFPTPHRIPVDGIMLFGHLTHSSGPLDILGADDGGPYPHTHLRVYPNDGAGSVSGTSSYTWEPLGADAPNQTILADLDNDGFDDVIVVGDRGIYVFMNDGTGRFLVRPPNSYTRDNGYLAPTVPFFPPTWSQPFRARWIAAAKTSPNGNIDVLVTPGANYDWRMWVLHGKGDGTFWAKGEGTAQQDPTFVSNQGYQPGIPKFVDVEGNGYPAIVTMSGANIQVFRNNKDGTFGDGFDWANPNAPHTAPATAISGDNPYYFAVNSAFIDLDHDGKLDMVLSSASPSDNGATWTGYLNVFRGLGGAQFSTTPTIAYTELPRPQAYDPGFGVWYNLNTFYLSITEADVDGDGQVDLLASVGQLGQPTVLRNNGDGTFSVAWQSSQTDINNIDQNAYPGTAGNVAFGLRLDYVDFNGNGQKVLFASNYRNNSFQRQTPWGENYGPNLGRPRDTTPPVITAPANITAEATGPSGATVTFTATAQDNVDGPVNVTASRPSGSTFALGVTTVQLSASDAAGNPATNSFTITVRDTTQPVISSLTASSASLWPPNHKMVAITLAASASDAVGLSSLKIISATSSETDNGLGDGDTAGDIEITGALTLNLRAERSGIGNGRVYTITVQARDAAGNATIKTVAVSVPKSQGK